MKYSQLIEKHIMNTLKELLNALCQKDFVTLSHPGLVWIFYLLVFAILFLENGILPAAFLPGDSLLVLIGVLISKGALNFILIVILLTTAASLGSWISYLQGKWLENNRLVKSWLSHIPKHYHIQAYNMFYKHGLTALFISRFISFLRTLLPTIAGLSGLGSIKFHFFNWISSFLWVFIWILVGCIFGKTSIFQHYEKEFMLFLMILPLTLLIIGLISSLTFIWRRKKIFFIEKTNKKYE